MPHSRLATGRILATVLFTDIVGSTERAAELGDRAWRNLLERHDAVVRRELKAFRGRVVNTAGDGFFAVFESPERAVRAAESIIEAVGSLGLAVRTGVHTGECELIGGKVGGMGVVIGARIADLAEGGQVLVSGSVRDMMTGSGSRFEGGEQQVLKGVADPWRVYRLVPEQDLGRAEVGSRRQASMVPLYTGRQRRRLLVLAASATALAVALAGAYVLTRTEPEVAVGDNAVGVLDGDTVTGAIDVGERPTGVAIGLGAVWVTNSTGGTVSRIDPDTHAAFTIPVGTGPAGVAVGAGAVWVANSGDGTVSRIDPRTNATTVVRVLPGPTGVVVAAGSVWVTNTLAAAVTQIDPKTSKVVNEPRVGANPTGIAYGARSLWVANQSDGTVTRLDPATLRTDPPITVGDGPVGIAVADGGVWVANTNEGSLYRIDVDDHRVTSRTIDADGGAYGVAASGRTVWVSNQYAGTLSRVDARRFTLVDTVTTRGAPLGLAVSGERLWFASAEGGEALHRGGVLRLAAQGLGGDFGPFDPAGIDPVAYDRYLWRLLAMTNNGLVGFRRTGGVGGSLPVPDLATSLPKPTDDGLTYTFRLRRGVRYSSGDPVRPGDIRRGIERTFGNKDGIFRFYQVIKGAAHCRPKAPPCDLSAGIVVDDRARTVTFHLTQQTPDFLRLLALPAAYATPAGTPVELPAGAHVPAT
ncbi:MAG TPA: ABC transporter substrate-binding protein, partial [Actinomycetes bacterium]